MNIKRYREQLKELNPPNILKRIRTETEIFTTRTLWSVSDILFPSVGFPAQS